MMSNALKYDLPNLNRNEPLKSSYCEVHLLPYL